MIIRKMMTSQVARRFINMGPLFSKNKNPHLLNVPIIFVNESVRILAMDVMIQPILLSWFGVVNFIHGQYENLPGWDFPKLDSNLNPQTHGASFDRETSKFIIPNPPRLKRAFLSISDFRKTLIFTAESSVSLSIWNYRITVNFWRETQFLRLGFVLLLLHLGGNVLISVREE